MSGTVLPSSGANPTELDIMMRVVDPCFDVIWAYTQTFDTTKVLDKLKKRAGVGSSSASVRSLVSTVETTMSDMRMNDKIALLERYLKRVKKEFSSDFFEDITTAMMMSESLYPGIRDLDFIARYLYREHDAYKGLLRVEDANTVNVANVFKHVFFAVVRFLLQDRRGLEAMKYITLPNKVSNASFDIARKRFCALVVDDTTIVPRALVKLSKELKSSSPKEVSVGELTQSNLKLLDAETQTNPDTQEDAALPQEDTTDEVHNEDSVREDEKEVQTECVVQKEDVVPLPEEEQPKEDVKPSRISTVNFPTPLGIAMNNFWTVPSWSQDNVISQSMAKSFTKSITRSIAPSLYSYSETIRSYSSEEESD